VVQLGERSAYRFDHEVTKAAALILLLVNLGATDTRSDRLWVFFDENGVLTHYGASLEAHRTQYALPWEDVHEEHEDRAADEDRGLVPDDDRRRAARWWCSARSRCSPVARRRAAGAPGSANRGLRAPRTASSPDRHPSRLPRGAG